MDSRAGLTNILVGAVTAAVVALIGVYLLVAPGMPEKLISEEEKEISPEVPVAAVQRLPAVTLPYSSPPPSSASVSPKSPAVRRSPIWGIPCVSNPKPVLTSGFTPLPHIRNIIPPGAAAGEEIKGHSYVDIDLTKGESIPLYAPADMELVEGAYYYEPPTFKVPTTYTFHFQVSCEAIFMLDHVTDPVDKIKKLFSLTPQNGTRHIRLAKPFPLKKGELIGYTKGGGNQQANINRFDLGFYLTTNRNQFVNLARYERSRNWKSIHAVCAYEYFSPELREAYRKKFTTFEGLRPIPDYPCSPPNRDRAGTLSGAWFFRENDSSVAFHVAIASDFDGKSLTVAGLPGGFFALRDTDSTFKDPGSVTAEHCYAEPPPRTRALYFRLLSPTKAELWDGAGPCPTSFPASGTILLYR